MHISEGVLSIPVVAGGWVLGTAGVALGLKKTQAEQIPKTALVSAVLFLASLVHVPVGPSSIHLTLLGLAGYLLGWSAIPALFTALLLQGLLFQFGGLLALGVNTAIMGTAALAGWGMRLLSVVCTRRSAGLSGATFPLFPFLAGFFAIIAGSALVVAALALSSEDLRTTAALIFTANVPLALVEGALTFFIVFFLAKAKPDVFKRS